MARILIAGCGDLGTALGERLTKQHEVYGLRRNVVRFPPGIIPIAADLSQPESLRDLPEFDVVVYAAAADSHNELAYRMAYVEGLRNLIAALRLQSTPVGKFLFVSSTSVYHQNSGDWVDENAPTQPASFSGKTMLEAETIVRLSDIPTAIVRCSGIYGPGRFRLIEAVARGYDCPAMPTFFTNRIHRDDAADLLAHLIRIPLAEDLYLATDCEPAAMDEIVTWMRGLLAMEGIQPGNSHPGMRRNNASKRCSNRRILATGFQFQYPDYRTGYSALIRQWARDIAGVRHD